MPVSLLAQAKQGNPEAIAILLNKKLHPRGFTIQVSRHDTTLDLVLTGQTIPQKAKAMPYLQRAFNRLDHLPFETVHITGQKYGTDRDMWTDTIVITPSSLSTHTTPTAQPQFLSSNGSSAQTIANKRPASRTSATPLMLRATALKDHAVSTLPIPYSPLPKPFIEPSPASIQGRFSHWLKRDTLIQKGLLFLGVLGIVCMAIALMVRSLGG